MMILTDEPGAGNSEGPIKLMLLTKPFFTTFMPPGVSAVDPKTLAQCIICISRSSKEQVDDTVTKAVSHGGQADMRPKTEMEKQMEGMGMYGRM